jgi:hypothetical protein
MECTWLRAVEGFQMQKMPERNADTHQERERLRSSPQWDESICAESRRDSIALDQTVLLHSFRDGCRKLGDEIVDPYGVERPAHTGPHQFVPLE